MIHSGPAGGGTNEALNLLLKRPWNPVIGMVPMDKQVTTDQTHVHTPTINYFIRFDLTPPPSLLLYHMLLVFLVAEDGVFGSHNLALLERFFL